MHKQAPKVGTTAESIPSATHRPTPCPSVPSVVNPQSAIPETELPTPAPETANSLIRKILLANPLFPKFYADALISSAPNSNEAKILRANYPKFLTR